MYYNKKNKRLKLMTLMIILVLVIGIGSFAIYVVQYDNQLISYQKSLKNLPEVKEVLEISEYNGEEEYYVAKVESTSGKLYYYFVKDYVVEHSFLVDDLISSTQAEQKALSLFNQGISKHYYLGIYKDEPIYEVLVGEGKTENYVMLNAKNGEVILQFEVK